MLAVLLKRNFGLLWFGELISITGNMLLIIALPYYVYDLTRSASVLGLMIIIQTIPGVLFGSVAGVFVDRWDRRRTMIMCDVMQALLLMPLLLFNSAAWLWLLYSIAFCQSVIGLFFNPAKTAIIPHLVRPDELTVANALNAISNSTTQLIGPALGGLLLVWLGLPGILIADAASYLVSAFMIAFIRMPHESSSIEADKPTSGHVLLKVWLELLDGLGVVRRSRTLSVLFVIIGLISFGQGIISTLVVPFVQVVLHGTAQDRGWVATGQGLGGLLGGFVAGLISRRFIPKYLLATCMLCVGTLWLLQLSLASLVFIMATMPLFGLIVFVFVVANQTLLQNSIPDRYRGRVFSAYMSVAALLEICGSAFASVAGSAIVNTADLAGLALIAAGCVALALPHAAQQPASAETVLPETAGT